MNNKGSAWIVWVIVGGIIFIALLFTILIIVNQDIKKKEADIYGNQTLNFYLMAKDSNYNSFLDGNYIIFNKTDYIKGNLTKGAFSEIKNQSNNITLEILCSSEGFYSTKINKSFSSQEKRFNSSKEYCVMDKIGEIEVDSEDKLENGEKKIYLTILSKGYYKNIHICSSWTSGIIILESEYNLTAIPQRYTNTVDKCYDINKSLSNEAIEVNFKIKSEGLNKLDYINFYIFDNEFAYLENNIFELSSELNGVNLGNKEDEVFTINGQ